MRILTSLFTSALILGLLSCGTSTSEENASAPSSAQKEPQEVPSKASPRKSYTPEELNTPYSTVSPWRYIVTGPETQYFERLVAHSELGRTIHGSGHAVLVPRDMTFENSKDWKSLIEEENREALVRFVQAHVLKGVQSIKQLEGVYENLNGDQVAIERNESGELVCGGARLLGQEVETDFGLVIPVMGMPEEIRWN